MIGSESERVQNQFSTIRILDTVGTNEAKRTKPDTDTLRALPKDQTERKSVALIVTRRKEFTALSKMNMVCNPID